MLDLIITENVKLVSKNAKIKNMLQFVEKMEKLMITSV